MKSILTMILCFGVFAFGSTRELGTLCANDCRYTASIPNPRKIIVGQIEWSGSELERYYNARSNAKSACEGTGGTTYSELNQSLGYICCALERVDGVVTPSNCPL